MPSEGTQSPRIDIALLLNNNQVQFTQSARRHRVGRARVMWGLATTRFVDVSAESDQQVRILLVGRDWSGRLLEVIAVIEDHRAVVIHAMDARPNVVRRYVEGLSHGTE